jgi:tetratricopeptide (TPR) repeat protein
MAERCFRLSVSPEAAPEVRRVLELGGRSSLAELHGVILRAYDLTGPEARELYGFFTSGRFWDAASAYLDPRVEGRRADRALLFRLNLRVDSRIAYLLGFERERRFVVSVLDVTEVTAPVAEPRVIEQEGDLASLPDVPPAELAEQDPPELSGLVQLAEAFLDVDDQLEPYADALAAARARSEPWDNEELLGEGLEAFKASAPAPRALPIEALTIFRTAAREALQLVEALRGQRRVFGQLDDWLLSRALGPRLLDLPRSLSLVGETELGLSLARAMTFIDPELLKGDIAVILAEAGRRDAALAQVDALLTDARDVALVEAKAGDTYRALGEPASAEAYYRRALEAAKAPSERLHALLRLVTCLTDSGRDAEASALLAQARQEREPEPKPAVGRNEPCPCGSGKKYKKCHGA